MVPTLLANASRWGLSNSTTQGTTMYTSVFEALKYQVGGRRKNEVHDVMFVAKDIPVPVWEGTRAQLVIKQDAHDTVHRVVVAQTAIVENEDTNYEDKTKAEGVLQSTASEWATVQEELKVAVAEHAVALSVRLVPATEFPFLMSELMLHKDYAIDVTMTWVQCYQIRMSWQEVLQQEGKKTILIYQKVINLFKTREIQNAVLL
jgi:hypothetical protein